MYLTNGSATVGTRLVAFFIYSVLAATAIRAETLKSVNGASIDSSVLEIYAESRTQKPLAELATADRQTLMAELTDLYLLSTQPGSADLKKDPRVAAQLELQERAIVAQAFASRFIANNVTTDEEIQAEYDRQAKSTPPLQFKARHILVPTQSEAIELIAKLDAGSDFATLAKESSTGPSAAEGGALPWFSPNQMVTPFSDAVAALENGKYTSEPVQTEFGWHVILREESRANEAPPLDSIRDNIKQSVAQKKFQAYLDKLRSDATSPN